MSCSLERASLRGFIHVGSACGELIGRGAGWVEFERSLHTRSGMWFCPVRSCSACAGYGFMWYVVSVWRRQRSTVNGTLYILSCVFQISIRPAYPLVQNFVLMRYCVLARLSRETEPFAPNSGRNRKEFNFASVSSHVFELQFAWMLRYSKDGRTRRRNTSLH